MIRESVGFEWPDPTELSKIKLDFGKTHGIEYLKYKDSFGCLSAFGFRTGNEIETPLVEAGRVDGLK